jgi:hypothetical protein
LGAAAVGGAGYYAGKRVSQNRQDDAMRDQQIADLQDQAAYQQVSAYALPSQPAPVANAPDTGSGSVAQLQQLAQLHANGVLTDEEFSAAKQKVLAGE